MMASAPSRDEARTLIDALLEEQRDLRAVQQFARWHEANPDARLTSHRSLIPLSSPKAGEQYAFEVDLDRCSGCKSCVAACHALNGLDENETWRSVGVLHGRGKNSFQQTITTACHHCVEPGCLEGCPVLAYDKDPLTGIVRHLDDQCIGCQYCVFMCPYEVPKYSERRGIVRKCDMCHQRLAHSEAPACVQACPSEAIRITVVEKEMVRAEYRRSSSREESPVGDLKTPPAPSSPSLSKLAKRLGVRLPPAAFVSRFFDFRNLDAAYVTVCGEPNRFLPDSPEPAITLPTTRYASKRPLPADLTGAKGHDLELEPAHAPLVWMLVLTQLGAGGFAFLPFCGLQTQQFIAAASFTAAIVGIAVSVLHLGRPQKAWRVFLGLRRSWMSREILAFGLFIILASLTTADLFHTAGFNANPILVWMTAIVGLAGVVCSGMTYHVTRRESWRGELSVGRFLSTTLLLGAGLAWWASAQVGAGHRYFAIVLALATLVKLSREFVLLRTCPDDADLDYELPVGLRAQSAFLMRFRLGVRLRLRLGCAWVGGVGLPLLSLVPHSGQQLLASAGFLLCVAGELIERALFFRAVVVSKMPGSAAS